MENPGGRGRGILPTRTGFLLSQKKFKDFLFIIGGISLNDRCVVTRGRHVNSFNLTVVDDANFCRLFAGGRDHDKRWVDYFLGDVVYKMGVATFFVRRAVYTCFTRRTSSWGEGGCYFGRAFSLPLFGDVSFWV